MLQKEWSSYVLHNNNYDVMLTHHEAQCHALQEGVHRHSQQQHQALLRVSCHHCMVVVRHMARMTVATTATNNTMGVTMEVVVAVAVVVVMTVLVLVLVVAVVAGRPPTKFFPPSRQQRLCQVAIAATAAAASHRRGRSGGCGGCPATQVVAGVGAGSGGCEQHLLLTVGGGAWG